MSKQAKPISYEDKVIAELQQLHNTIENSCTTVAKALRLIRYRITQIETMKREGETND